MNQEIFGATRPIGVDRGNSNDIEVAPGASGGRVRAALRRVAAAVLDPLPLRVRLARYLIARAGVGSYRDRLAIDAVERPQYGFCLLNAALLARALGERRISALEFGVAGGNGLVGLEAHAAAVEAATGVECEIYGFDTGRGLPRPEDVRDLPYLWREGFYAMDVARLEARLRRSKLVLGDVAETVQTFFAAHAPAPVGAVLVDLDLYSATAAALGLFRTADARHVLPRVLFYFDDITGGPAQGYNEFTGERLAIAEFNDASADRKLARLDLAHQRRLSADWNERIYLLHNFDHPLYTRYVGPDDDQRPLDG